jgi:hypothetical protein
VCRLIIPNFIKIHSVVSEVKYKADSDGMTFPTRVQFMLFIQSLLAYKELPGRPRHRWEDSIKMDLREIG